MIHHAWIAAALAGASAWGVLTYRRRLRPHARTGHCAACGYNLSGNVSGTCPECGTSTSAGATA